MSSEVGGMRSSADVTKLLRLKATPLDDILTTAVGLIENKEKVYLPNKTNFLIELFCDRLNDNNFFKSWKYEVNVWRFLLRLWQGLGDTPKARSKIIKKIKLIQLAIDVLNNSTERKNLDLARGIFEFLEAAVLQNYITIDEHQSVLLLESYSSLLLSFTETSSLSTAEIDHWTSLVDKIFQTPIVLNGGVFSKKNTTRFCQVTLPSLLNAIVTLRRNEKAEETLRIFESVISNALLSDTSVQSLVPNTIHLLKNDVVSLSLEDLRCFFEIVIRRLSSDRIKTCEELFITIVSNTDIPEISLNLLQFLLSTNKSLSFDFYRSIYDSEIKGRTPDRLNWDLLQCLICLDVDLALDVARETLENIPETIGKDTALSIGKALTDAFVRARDFSLFIKTHLINAVERNRLFRKSEFIDYISSKVNNLSLKEIPEVLKSIQNNERAVSLYAGVIKGLVYCSDDKIENAKSVLLSSHSLTYDYVELWEVRFYIMCIYRKDAGEHFRQLIVQNAQSNPKIKYYYYCAFRMIETLPLEENLKFNAFETGYINFLESCTSDQLLPLLKDTIKRWPVILNMFFSDLGLDKFIDILVHDNNLVIMLQILSESSDVLFEQARFMTKLVDSISEKLNEKDQLGVTLALLQLIPEKYLDKHIRIKVTNDITSNNYIFKNDDLANLAFKCLFRLLARPTGKARIEMNINSMFNFIQMAAEHSKVMASDLVILMWEKNPSVELKFDIVKKLLQYIDTFDMALIFTQPIEFNITSKILNNFLYLEKDDVLTVEIRKLKTKFLNFVSNALSECSANIDELVLKTIDWLLDVCNNLFSSEENNSHQIVCVLKSLGSSLKLNAESDIVNSIKCRIFLVFTQVYSASTTNSRFLVALYLLLAKSVDVKNTLDNALDNYFQKLSVHPEMLQQLFVDVLESINDPDNAYIEQLVSVCVLLLQNLKTDEKKDAEKLVTKWLSTLISNFELLIKMNINCWIYMLDALRTYLTSKTWIFGQYEIENILAFISKVSSNMFRVKMNDSSKLILLYTKLTQVVSNIILYHRFRLTSRHHITMAMFINLLLPLSLNSPYSVKHISFSTDAAHAYTRLLSNLCEPSNVNIKDVANTSLTSSASVVRKLLRKHIPLLLTSYISTLIKYNFEANVSGELLRGIYLIFDVLSRSELHLVNALLDTPGRSYYRTLLSSYRDHGKWKDD